MNKVMTCMVVLSLIHIPIFATADKSANPETKALYFNMITYMVGNGILMGHQNDLIGGKSNGGWKDALLATSPDTLFNSDVFQVCGDYPAVHGFDIGGIVVPPMNQNLDWHNLAFMRKAIIKAYNQKALITVSYHMHNPKMTTDQYGTHHYGAWIEDVDHALITPFPDILQEGTALNDTLKVFLKGAGDYFKSLRTTDTIPTPTTENPDSMSVIPVTVPVIFRPYHELNGGWFWWGTNTCTEEQYIALWQYTFTYLTEDLDVHNLLFCWSPSGAEDEAGYMYGYPGDEYVDIFGLDEYGEKDFYKGQSFKNKINVAYEQASLKGKPLALTETGIRNPTIFNAGETYFFDFFEWLQNAGDINSNQLLYVLFWRNLDGEYQVPYKRHELAPDFKNLYESGNAMFGKYLRSTFFSNGLGPYVVLPEDFPTLKKEKQKDEISISQLNGSVLVELWKTTDGMVEIFDINGRKLFTSLFKGNRFLRQMDYKEELCIVKVTTSTSKTTRKLWVR